MNYLSKLFYGILALTLLAASQFAHSQDKRGHIVTEVDFRAEGYTRDWEEIDRLFIFEEATGIFYDKTFGGSYNSAEFQEKIIPIIIVVRVGIIVLPAIASGISEYLESRSIQRAGIAAVVNALAGGYGALATARAVTNAGRVFFLGAATVLTSSSSAIVGGGGGSDGGNRDNTDSSRDGRHDPVRPREREGSIVIGEFTEVCRGRDCIGR
jgi:hypothetical protein